ncbi:MAG TPA: carbohydrate ABC transporter permease [Streptosporangiaceae bacterium]|nr:carbohydrate ABC transporter permease [Streptosporangiaceae bacterium]
MTALRRRLPAVIVSLIGVLFLVPFAWLVVVAFQQHGTLELSGGGSFTLDHFGQVLHGGFLSALGNSLYLAGGTMVATTVIGVLAAYPLSRFQSRTQRYFVYVLVFLTGLPVVAIIIPTYDFFVAADFINSKFWTVWFMTATALPFGTWIACSFIDAVPRELEEASWIDGMSRWGSLLRIVVPLIVPGMCVVAVYTFVNAWGEFFIPFILLQSQNAPASVTMFSYFGQYNTNYSEIAAFALLYSLPPVALYLIVTRWVGQGFALTGAIKG